MSFGKACMFFISPLFTQKVTKRDFKPLLLVGPAYQQQKCAIITQTKGYNYNSTALVQQSLNHEQNIQ